jgi:hypothetical protein
MDEYEIIGKPASSHNGDQILTVVYDFDWILHTYGKWQSYAHARIKRLMSPELSLPALFGYYS